MTTPCAVDAVQAQLDAYNRGDAVDFARCYSPDATIIDGAGRVRVQGRTAIEVRYGQLFARHPALQAAVLSRSAVGGWVVDHELVVGGPDDAPLEAIAVYRVEKGLIAEVRLLE